MDLNLRTEIAWIKRRPVLQFLMVMKLIIFIITITCIQVSARSYGQLVTLDAHNTELPKVFTDIQHQTGYRFFWEGRDLSQTKVTLQLKNVQLADALDQLFSSLPYTYAIEKKSIVVSEKQPTFIDKLKNKVEAIVNNIDVRGRVVGEDGQPLGGATVQVKDGNNTTATDPNGFFTLSNVDPNATLVISFIGYDKLEVKVKAQLGTIKLAVAQSKLDEVQVIAYGQTTQRLSVGNVSTVSSKTIEQQPVQNPLLALEGQAPGVFITQNSGMPGAGVTVRVQGINSLANGNDPLFVVDGVPYPGQNLSTTIGSILGKSGVGNGYGSPLSYINPADIESISVLKDADATAIYGSRAANGAILITTKKGKAGQTKVDFNAQQGWGTVAHFIPLLNTQQYLQMRQEAAVNDGTTLSLANGDYDVLLWDKTRYTNWQKVLLGATAQYANYGVNISGGTTNTQYLVGSNFNRQTSVFPTNNADERGSLHFSLNTASENHKFKLQLTGSYLSDNNQLPQGDPTSSIVLSLPPDAPPLYNPNGSLNWQEYNGAGSWSNPLAIFNRSYQNKTNNLIGNAVVSYEFFPGLQLRANFGYNNLQTDETYEFPLSAIDPAFQSVRGANGRRAQYSYNTSSSWIAEPLAEYTRQIARGKLDVLLGGTFTQQNSNGFNLNGQGYNSDALLGDLRSAATLTAGTSQYAEYKYDAVFGRLNYNWNDKYIIDLNARHDGSSRFGPDSRFHDFWSAGLGWIFSEENWVKSSLPFLSFGKLRGSYGTTGNDQIGDYRYLNLYRSINITVPYQGQVGLQTTNLPNPYLQWEETHKLQAGIDLGFFKDRILLAANYVRNRSSNQLAGIPLPFITGFSNIAGNVPLTLENKAWELSLSTINIKGKDFSWRTNINFTLPENKLIAQPANGVYFIGKSPFLVPVFHFLGVDPQTGVYQFAGAQGPTSNPSTNTDQTVFVNTALPQYYGGIGNTLTYKQFSLDFFFQLVRRTMPVYIGQFVPGASDNNVPATVLSRWQQPGDITNIERYNQDGSLYTQWNDLQNSDAGYQNFVYLRLKNLSLSYQVPTDLLRRAHIQNLRVFLQGQNLLTFSKYQGLDPETGNSVLPPLRMITAGINLGL